MERIDFWKHNDKIIVFFDFSNCQESEIYTVLKDARATMRTLKKSTLLTLVDVTNAESNSKTNNALRDFSKENKSYVKASAIVGITGIKKIAFKVAMKFTGRKNIKPFSTLDEAKNWLTTQ